MVEIVMEILIGALSAALAALLVGAVKRAGSQLVRA